MPLPCCAPCSGKGNQAFFFFLPATASPTKPAPMRSMVAGSGTGEAPSCTLSRSIRLPAPPTSTLIELKGDPENTYQSWPREASVPRPTVSTTTPSWYVVKIDEPSFVTNTKAADDWSLVKCIENGVMPVVSCSKFPRLYSSTIPGIALTGLCTRYGEKVTPRDAY